MISLTFTAGPVNRWNEHHGNCVFHSRSAGRITPKDADITLYNAYLSTYQAQDSSKVSQQHPLLSFDTNTGHCVQIGTSSMFSFGLDPKNIWAKVVHEEHGSIEVPIFIAVALLLIFAGPPNRQLNWSGTTAVCKLSTVQILLSSTVSL